MLIRRQRAIAQALNQTTLLPFLYQTRTIARRYATGTESVDEVLDSEDAPAERSQQHNRYRQEAQRDAPREHISFIPFEGSGNEHADFEGSTITPRERKAFEKLFKLRQAKDGEKEAGARGKETPVQSQLERKGNRQILDDILDATDEEENDDLYPPPLQRMARDAREQRIGRSKPSQSDAIEAAANRDKIAFNKRLSKAKTDIEVWDLLQKHVLKRVIALNLDAPPSKKSKKATERREDASFTAAPTLPTKGNHKDQPLPISDLDILTQTLPHHLSSTLRTLTTHFPSSTLPLNLLPTLRRLGPTAFALGTSTFLFNGHMRLLFTQHLDLDGVLDTLAEMDAQVFEYDQHTEILMERVVRHARRALEGEWGEGVRRLWEREAMRRKVQMVFGYRRKVRQRREEEALRRARAEEKEREGGREGGEEEG